MNEAERTEVAVLLSAVLDFVGLVDAGRYVDKDDSEEVREAVKRVLPYVYG